MHRRLTRLRAALVRIGFALGRLRRVERRVVLATSHADRLSGNLAEIDRHLRTMEPRPSVVRLARAVRPGLGGVLAAAVDAIVAGWHLATAAVFVVDDHYFPMYAIRPRAGTRRIQVWHASGAFKKFGYSLADKGYGAESGAIAAVPIHTNYDLCLVSASRFAPFYAEAFRQPITRFTSQVGIPRTDLFFDEPRMAAAAEAVRRRYRLPEGRRVLLYAPTFRGASIAAARSPSDLDLPQLQRELGDSHVVLLRAHPFVAQHARRDPEMAGFVVDVSGWPDVHELMLVSDALVTDYSSVIYEFALLGRPIGFFAPDHATYEAERGFYLDFATDLPGPVCETTAALAAWLRAGTFDLERVARFAAESFDVADGRATARLVDEVILPALR